MREAELVMRLILIGVLLLEATYTAVQSADFEVNKPGCEDRCGDVSIPYPFGTKPGCYRDEDFSITCNSKTLFLKDSNIQVTNISVAGKLHIMQFIAKDCYDNSGARNASSLAFPANLSKFTISNTDNKFVAVGCDTQATIQGYQANQRICYDTDQPAYQPANPQFKREHYSKKPGAAAIPCSGHLHDSYSECFPTPRERICYDVDQTAIQNKSYSTGCISQCGSIDYVANYSCSGLGCCQTSIPKGMTNFTVTVSSPNNHTDVRNFSPCSYAFVVEERYFNFSWEYLSIHLQGARLPVVLDWSIGNETCEVLQQKNMTTACQGNSTCYDPENGSAGYLCNCNEGYGGNPYLGCLDIDECKDPQLNKCVHNKTCENIERNYTCSCPKGYYGDGKKNGDGCIVDQAKIIEITIGVGVAIIMVLLIGSCWFYRRHKKQKLIKRKKKFFRQNGGVILKQRLSSSQGRSTETIKIFTEKELEKATNNYDERSIVGRGGYCTVYKGNLTDGQTVAIKKSKIGDQGQIKQFVKEVIERPQINHRNVVKLLGCCLETEIPLLVYEFLTNGTLFDLIHKRQTSIISWEMRLKIAAETAQVLSVFHSSTPPIIHKDVKSENILLDNSYTPKVYDFRASRLVSVNRAGLSTTVQGTLGYLDPEYVQTSQLTKKSDVYSFGVILVELLTGKKAISFDRLEKEKTLSKYFLSAKKENRLSKILEGSIPHFEQVSNIAERCLKMGGEHRPTMTEVANELEGLCNN